MEMRKMKGLQIAETSKILKSEKGWVVPSQSGNKNYLVRFNYDKPVCNCKDYEKRGHSIGKCKHIFATELFIKKDIDNQGNTTITKAVRMTYKQDWKAYREAQNNEVKLFDILLKDLVNGIEEPKQTMGRPRLSLKETLFCAIQKVYSQLSSRRAYSLYRNAEEREQIIKVPNYNAINKILNRKEITPILQKLLVISALPLKSVETTFAPDSSGFRTSQFNQYAVEKYGIRKQHKWVKAHILAGNKTNIIASARITDEYKNDSPQFEPLVSEAYENGFTIKEVSADKAYSSRKNMKIVNDIGGIAYIPFKKNVNGKAEGSLLWRKMWLLFMYKNEEFMEHYHKRSNVETVFMMVKAKFGDKLKSKNDIAQKNELLCKFIAHNICVIIQEMFELGIDPTF